MEVVTEGQTTSEHTNNYEISEQFSYFDGDVNEKHATEAV